MTRERRVSPAVSSLSAARVSASTSRKPNAASRSSTAAGLQRSRAGESVEQWREEQPLVDRPHHRNLGLVLGVERFERGAVGGVAEAEHAGEVGPLAVVGGERVRLVLVDELEPMLDGTQPDVGVIEGPCVSAW